jgi:hypothetical protein
MIALASMVLALALDATTPAVDLSTQSGQPVSPSPTAQAGATTINPQPSTAPDSVQPGAPVAPAARRPTPAQLQARLGDVSGGQFIPPQVLKILGDKRLDPDVAYMLWQLSRRQLDDWTLSELGWVAQIAPTLVEASLPIEEIQILYQFWGLDPSDVFNPTLGANWQSKSTAYSPNSATSVGAISSSECQVDASQMTLATFRSCIGANQ